jgi:uncharacterized protein (DUF2147 family)
MLSMLFAMAAAAQSADSVVGTWHSPVKNGIINIQKCGTSLCGTLESGDDIKANPAAKDVNNKDASQRGRQLKGIQMLSGFSWDGSTWSGGKVYNPNDGGTYSGKITPVDANSLKLRGCIIWPACKTDTWTRVR